MKQFFLTLGAISIVIATSTFAIAASTPTNQIEVLQAQATLQFHSKQTDACMQTLQKILAIDSKNVSALEMKALTLRQLGNDEAAEKVYETLLTTNEKSKHPAYHFELGTIQYKKSKFKDARSHFFRAAVERFNPGTSHFFIGVIDFNSKAWRNAKNNLTAALTYSDSEPMKPVAHYYLANTYAQLGKSDAAIRNYGAAYGEASEKKSEEDETNKSEQNKSADSGMFADIRRNAMKELKNMDRGSSFINLTLLSQWDSNVQTNPSEVQRNANEMSAQRSAKGVLSAAFGVSTSPTRLIQVTPSYRFFTNYNFNYLTKDFNFMSHTPGIYILMRPYARLSGGVKAEGTLSMKNNYGAEQSGVFYRKYSQTGDIGPVVKYEVGPMLQLLGEVSWRPKKYFTDPVTGDSRRSGNGISTKITADISTPYSYLTPTVYVSHEWDRTDGKSFRAYNYGFGVSNPLNFTEKLTLTPSLDFLISDYYASINPKRDDFMSSLRLVANYTLSTHWNLMADVGYTMNDSSVSTSFKYNRFVVSGGASYTF